MTAAGALTLTLISKTRSREQGAYFMEPILKAALDGRRSVFISDPLSPEDRKILLEIGYSVKQMKLPTSAYICEISW